MSRVSLPNQIAYLALAALLAFVILLWVSVSSFTARMDHTAEEDSLTRVRDQVAALHEQVSIVAADYTHWSDLYFAAQRGDVDYLGRNYGVSATRGEVFDHGLLYGGPLPAPLAWSAGGGADPGPSFLPPGVMAQVAAQVGLLPLGSRQTFDFNAMLGGQPVQFSASFLLTDTVEDIPAGHGPFAVSVIGHSLTPEMLAGIDAAVSPFPAGPGRVGLALPDVTGAPAAYLTWAPPQPGTALFARVRPLLIGITLVAAVVAASAAWLVHANARSLIQRASASARMARTDSLTDLPNRHAFIEHLDRIERQCKGRVAVSMLDLDGFKHVNDTAGHHAGDSYLRAFARRLQPLQKDGWFLARIGGDEFAAVLSEGEDIAASGAGLSDRLAILLSQPVPVGTRMFGISVSQGSACGPALRVHQLMREADAAMYDSKRHRQTVRPIGARMRSS